MSERPTTVTLSLEAFERVVRVINANAHAPFCKDVRVVQIMRDALIADGAVKRGEHAYFAVLDNCAERGGMPTLPVEAMVRNLPSNTARIIRAAFRQSNGETAKLRATKPFRKIDPKHPCAMFEASANYVWRILCYDFTTQAPYRCFPCNADFDLYKVLKVQCEKAHQATRDVTLVLNQQIELAESVMPVTVQRGAMSWRGLV